MDPGKRKRLKRIMPDGRTAIVPMDHGVTVGPVQGLTNMQRQIKNLIAGGVDAIVVHKGIAKNVDSEDLGLIVHISANTKYSLEPNLKVPICSVEEALRLGADAVSVHVNVGGSGEKDMLKMLGRAADECDRYGLPLLAMMYPRGEKIKSEHDPESVAHAARLGAELGADIVKTVYTGSRETFREVVDSCPVPVVIAGGPRMDTSLQVLEMVDEALSAGCAGVSIGRNVFQHEDPTKMSRALALLVHGKANLKEAVSILGE
ncbi:MAG: 2-amino-3,7-dideoxy-D-threo-hept-6-ulosonate synthase [Candidatus Bathyarchaeia archaeon]